MLHYDYIEWLLLIATSAGLLFLGWGVMRMSELTDRGMRLADKSFREIIASLSTFDRAVLYVSLMAGSLTTACGFVMLVMYGWEKYYQ